ncbi:unannotated protein [freshwater metagenome]|uniref:Unannotated protein n=1 Tax=freshwater metagenome TaxID=449393 RepID=A0A6J7D823_9ZZZZ|nr:hypothetical protein [Actinomycetota bacterium]
MSLIPFAQGGMQAIQGMQGRFGGQGGPPQGGPRQGEFGPRGFGGHMGGHGVSEASFWIVSSVALALLIALVVLAVLLLRELRRRSPIAAPAQTATIPSEAPTVAQPPQPGSSSR